MVLGPSIRKILPYINFVVATSALGFQYFVLYPWHKELDKDFRELREEQNLTLEEYHKKKLVRLQEIETNIVRLEEHHNRIADAQQKLGERILLFIQRRQSKSTSDVATIGMNDTHL